MKAHHKGGEDGGDGTRLLGGEHAMEHTDGGLPTSSLSPRGSEDMNMNMNMKDLPMAYDGAEPPMTYDGSYEGRGYERRG